MVALHLHFRPGISLQSSSPTLLTLSTLYGELRWENPPAHLVKTLHALLEEGGTEEELSAEWPRPLYEYYYLLEKLKKQGLLCYSLVHQTPIATLIPAYFEDVRVEEPSADTPLQWSQGAHLQSCHQSWWIETKGGSCQLHLHDSRYLEIIWQLAAPKKIDELIPPAKISKKAMRGFLSLLHTASALETNMISHTSLSTCIRRAHELCHQQLRCQ